MKRYKSLKEQETPEVTEEQPEVILDPMVTKILRTMRDESFGNDSQRRKFCSLLVSMHNSRDPRVRKIFRLIGEYCTSAIPEIIK